MAITEGRIVFDNFAPMSRAVKNFLSKNVGSRGSMNSEDSDVLVDCDTVVADNVERMSTMATRFSI